MIGYSSEDMARALLESGLKRGDLILVSTNLLGLGRMTDARSAEEALQLLLRALFRIIGEEEGTLVVHTYTTQVGRYGVPFVLEETECVNGAFCEYVRSYPGSMRSLHPIYSFAGLGQLKKEICEDNSSSNYGLDSPLDRMLKRDVQIVTLGIDYFKSVYVHHMETLYGVPYLYNKLLDVEVYAEGKKVEKPFFSSVRYLDYPLSFSWNRLKKALEKRGCVSSVPLGAGQVSRVPAKEYCQAVLELLKEDPYALLEKPPPFVKGSIPFDGITAHRDGVTDRGNYHFLKKERTL